jgi:hypothetical protein
MTQSVRIAASLSIPGTSWPATPPAIPTDGLGRARSSKDASSLDSTAAPHADFRSVMEKQSSEQDEPSSSDSRDAGDSEQPRHSVPGVTAKAAAAPQVRGAALPAGIYPRSTQAKGGAAAATPDPPQAPSTTASTAAYSIVPQISQIAVTAGPIHFSIGTLPGAPAAASLQDQSDQPESFRSQIEPQTEQGTPSPVTAVPQQGNSPQATAGPQASTALHATIAPPSVNSLNPVKSGPLQYGQILFGTAGFFKIPGASEAAAAPAQSSAAMTASNAIGSLSPTATDDNSGPVSSTKSDPSAGGSSNQPTPGPSSVDRTPLNLDLSNASLFAGNPQVANPPVGNPVPGNPVASSPATAAQASPKQRMSTFNAASTSQNASASQNSGDLFTLNPTVLPSAGDPEASVGAAQTAASSPPASPQDSSSSNGGPDYGDLHVEATAAAAPGTSNPVAFEARLSPLQGSAPTADPALAQPSQAAEQFAYKPSSAWSSAETNAGPAGAATSAAAAAKPETLFDSGAAATPAPSTSPAATRGDIAQPGAQPAASAAERMQSIIEAPAPLAGSRQSITVKVPGATSDTGIDLRFVERGGDIHLSVRTASPEMAQELRGGLNDLVGRLEHAGIRTEVSNTSSSGSATTDSSKDQGEADRKGYSRNPGDSPSQQQNSRSNRSRWMEALENSNSFSKEQNT